MYSPCHHEYVFDEMLSCHFDQHISTQKRRMREYFSLPYHHLAQEKKSALSSSGQKYHVGQRRDIRCDRCSSQGHLLAECLSRCLFTYLPILRNCHTTHRDEVPLTLDSVYILPRFPALGISQLYNFPLNDNPGLKNRWRIVFRCLKPFELVDHRTGMSQLTLTIWSAHSLMVDGYSLNAMDP
jgi:hypothetical protein